MTSGNSHLYVKMKYCSASHEVGTCYGVYEKDEVVASFCSRELAEEYIKAQPAAKTLAGGGRKMIQGELPNSLIGLLANALMQNETRLFTITIHIGCKTMGPKGQKVNIPIIE